MLKTTGIYVRVSTEEQAINGFSIAAQKEKLYYYAKEIKNWNVVDIYSDEGISAKDIEHRPQLLRLLNDIKSKKINNVLVFKIDRLTRSTKDLIELVDFFNMYNCSFNSLNESIDTTTATGRMFIKIIGIFAEFERENIIERVKLGFERKVKEGYSICSSTAPYGYNKIKGNDVLIKNIEESNVVKTIYKMFLNDISISKIVFYLNKSKVKTKKNKRWSYKTVKLILTNSTYIGDVRYGVGKKKSFCSKGYHEPLISKSDFQKVQFKIKSKKFTDAYYSHILKCCCGNDMVPKRIYKIDKNNNKRVYINYRCCKKTDNCNRDISHMKLDKLMIDLNHNWNKLNMKQRILFLNNKKIYYNKRNKKLVFF